MPDTDPPALPGDLQILVGSSLERLQAAPDWVPFCPAARDFVGALSRALMKEPQARAFPEIISLAHWMRPKALLELQERFTATRPEKTTPLPRGIALHFAPGNVDTIFLYSALLAVLTGNRNIVRISSRPSARIDLMVSVINRLLSDTIHADLRDRLLILRYEHDDKVTRALSDRCDLRIVWGGDAAVQSIHTLPLPPRSRDVSFPNRWSLAILNSPEVLALDPEALDQLAVDFSNDSYWFGQMACSSPRLVLWLGEEAAAQAAADRFWPAVHKAAGRFAPEIAPVSYVNKLVSQLAASIDGSVSAIRALPDNLVSVSALKSAMEPDDDLCVGEGLFWEARLDSLDAIAPLLDTRSQTLISYGIAADQWQALVQAKALRIDRIVPFGQALQFGHIWDGMDLLGEFSRLVRIEV